MNTAVRTVSRCGRRQCILSVNAGVVFSRIRSKHVQISLRLFSGMSPRRNITVQAESSGSTVKADEVSKFERMASSWWDDVDGQMKELHSMNRLRYMLIICTKVFMVVVGQVCNFDSLSLFALSLPLVF